GLNAQGGLAAALFMRGGRETYFGPHEMRFSGSRGRVGQNSKFQAKPSMAGLNFTSWYCGTGHFAPMIAFVQFCPQPTGSLWPALTTRHGIPSKRFRRFARTKSIVCGSQSSLTTAEPGSRHCKQKLRSGLLPTIVSCKALG